MPTKNRRKKMSLHLAWGGEYLGQNRVETPVESHAILLVRLSTTNTIGLIFYNMSKIY